MDYCDDDANGGGESARAHGAFCVLACVLRRQRFGARFVPCGAKLRGSRAGGASGED